MEAMPATTRRPTALCASKFLRQLLAKNWNFVSDIGGAWIPGQLRYGEEYLEGALGRFVEDRPAVPTPSKTEADPSNYYKIPRPGLMWNGTNEEPLSEDGGRKRAIRKRPAQLPLELQEESVTQYELLPTDELES
jgi:hypothetical protein